MALPYLGTVRLISDKYRDEGAPRGAIGVILEVWGDGSYEVEVSNPETGETVAWLTAVENDLALVVRSDAEQGRRTAD